MQLVYVIGPARSGTTLFASLLDGHPDLLVWPREWLFHTSFWKTVPGDGPRKSAADVTRAAMPMFRKIAQPVSEDRYGKVHNAGEFDMARLLERLGAHDRRMVGPHEYLRLLGEAFADACARYSASRPRHFVIKVMLSGIEWNDPSPLDDARVFWMSRPIGDSYRSQRDKYFTMKSDRTVGPDRRAYHFFRDQCLPLLYLCKQAVDVRRALTASRATHIVDLRRLRRAPEDVMRAAAGFLDVPFQECLLAPTFLGAQYDGHFQDRALNVGRIVDADSQHPEPTPFERRYLDLLDEAVVTGRLPPLGSRGARWRAVLDSLRDLPQGSLFSALAAMHMIAADRRMGRIWNRDLATDAYDPTLVYRPPRGIKTRLMKRFAKGTIARSAQAGRAP